MGPESLLGTSDHRLTNEDISCRFPVSGHGSKIENSFWHISSFWLGKAVMFFSGLCPVQKRKSGCTRYDL
jgi:hypothetical protein